MKITVKNCNNCPFCNNDNEYGYSCNYPESEVEEFEMSGYDSELLPEKCPLKKGDVLVTLDL